jgi:hypothetical protein
MSLPHVTVLVSDDLRFEIGNKLTIVGLYTVEMVFSAPEVPKVLPRIAFSFFFRWQNEEEITPFTMQIFGPGDAEAPIADFQVDPTTLPKPHFDRDGMPPGLMANLQMDGIPLNGPGAFEFYAVSATERRRVHRLPVSARLMEQAAPSQGIPPA